jgi:hypothetical protein
MLAIASLVAMRGLPESLALEKTETKVILLSLSRFLESLFDREVTRGEELSHPKRGKTSDFGAAKRKQKRFAGPTLFELLLHGKGVAAYADGLSPVL